MPLLIENCISLVVLPLLALGLGFCLGGNFEMQSDGQHFHIHCGHGLWYNSNQTLKNFTGISLQECGLSCLQNDECELYNYWQDSKIQHCELFKERPPCHDLHENVKASAFIRERICHNGTLPVEGVCVCRNGTYGNLCEKRFRDCSDYHTYGWPGPNYQILYIWPDNYPVPFQTKCFILHGGYTYFQVNERGYAPCDLSLPLDFFNKDWSSYKEGFGDVNCKHWLGLEKIHHLSIQGVYELAVTMRFRHGPYSYVQSTYSNVWVDSEERNYTLYMDGFRNNPYYPSGDSLLNPTNPYESPNGQMFSTYDKDNDNYIGNCAQEFQAGFWFNNCTAGHVNGWVVDTKDGLRDDTVPSILWKHDWGHKAIYYTDLRLRRVG